MRYVSLLLIAWVVNWLILLTPGGDGRDIAVNAVTALLFALFYSFVAWLYLRKRYPNNPSLLLTPTFVMIGVIAFFGFTGDYIAAKDTGLDFISSTLSAITEWPGGILVIFALAGAIFVNRKSTEKHDN